MNDGVNVFVHAELAINKKPIYFTIKICVFFIVEKNIGKLKTLKIKAKV